MLIARAYRHTEKLLLDNRDKLTLVGRPPCFVTMLLLFQVKL